MVGRVLCCKGVVTNVLGGFLLSSTTLLTPWLASFVCSYWVSSTSCTYMPWSLQVFKCEKFPDIYSRSEYKVTLRTRKRVKQMFFFLLFFSFLRNAISVRMMQHKRMYVYLLKYVHMGGKYYEFSNKRATNLILFHKSSPFPLRFLIARLARKRSKE